MSVGRGAYNIIIYYSVNYGRRWGGKWNVTRNLQAELCPVCRENETRISEGRQGVGVGGGE